MTEPKFVLSPQAIDDLDQIWLHISQHSPDAANRVDAELRKAIRTVAEHPDIGHRRDDLTELPG